MNEIRIKSGIDIKVNENGDIITVHVEDQKFIDKFYDMIQRFENIKNTFECEDVKAAGERQQLTMMIDKTKEIMEVIDDIFGENACKKIFGDIIPNPYLIADFFEQLTPIVEQYISERQKKITQKYNRGRKGGRSKR